MRKYNAIKISPIFLGFETVMEYSQKVAPYEMARVMHVRNLFVNLHCEPEAQVDENQELDLWQSLLLESTRYVNGGWLQVN